MARADQDRRGDRDSENHQRLNEMKTENVTKANHSAQFLVRDIVAAHKDAVESGNQFAEIILLDLIEAAAKLEQKLKRLAAAAEEA